MAGLSTRSLLKISVRLCVAARSPAVSFDFFAFAERDGPETNATQNGPWALLLSLRSITLLPEG